MSANDPLRDELARLAQPPSDTSGVADAVLERIAALPPGGGGGGGATGGGAGAWAVGTGIAASLALVAGVAVGLRSDEGSDPTVTTDEVAASVLGADQVVLRDCPAGAEVGTLDRGDRVLVVAQAEDGAWVAVRRPTDLRAEAWVEADLVVPDDDLEGVPEGGCGDRGELALVLPGGETQVSVLGPPTVDGEAPGSTTTTTTAPGQPPAPTVPGQTPPPTQGPGGTPPPTAPTTTTTAPPADTTGPAIANASATPGSIHDVGGCGGQTSSTIAANVTDPSGVASVTASWTVANKPPVTKAMTGGANRSTTFTTGGAVPFSWNQQPVTVTITAKDAEGNQSTAQVVVKVTYCFA